MNADVLKDQIIKPKLVEVFGDLLASSIVIKATLAALAGKDEEERKRLMIETVCSHERVIAMWGESRALRQKQEWLKRAAG